MGVKQLKEIKLTCKAEARISKAISKFFHVVKLTVAFLATALSPQTARRIENATKKDWARQETKAALDYELKTERVCPLVKRDTSKIKSVNDLVMMG